MAIAVTGANSGGGTGTAASLTHGLTINEDDVVIAIVNISGGTSIVDNNGADSFDTDLTESYAGKFIIASRVAGASEPSAYAWTLGATERWSITILVASGVDTASIYDISPIAGNVAEATSSTPSSTSITTLSNNALAIMSLGIGSASSQTVTSPTNGFTEQSSQESTGQLSSLLSKTIATAGATGATAVTLSASKAWSTLQFALKIASAGPTVTGPTTATEGTSVQLAGTGLDTATAAGFKSGAYVITNTIDAQTATTLDLVPDLGAPTQGVPVASMPITPDVTAAGITAHVLKSWVNDGTNPDGEFTLTTLLAPSGNTTVQAMITTSNVTETESVLAPSIVPVLEDDMQYTGPSIVDTVTITYNADGTLTLDKDQTINFDLEFWIPSDGKRYLANITVTQTTVISGVVPVAKLTIGIGIGI